MVTEISGGSLISNSNITGAAAVYCGLSTDSKPDAANGAMFLEMDTAKIYLYDETNTQWREF